MTDMIKDIADFHERFGLERPAQPRLLDDETTVFRVSCLDEEVDEFRVATSKEDLAGALDALVDLVYFALGTAHIMGLPFEPAWDLVHEANMQKVRAKSVTDSKRGSALDVVKPDGWAAPDLTDLVRKGGGK